MSVPEIDYSVPATTKAERQRRSAAGEARRQAREAIKERAAQEAAASRSNALSGDLSRVSDYQSDVELWELREIVQRMLEREQERNP